jgi:hypothetical protein
MSSELKKVGDWDIVKESSKVEVVQKSEDLLSILQDLKVSLQAQKKSNVLIIQNVQFKNQEDVSEDPKYLVKRLISMAPQGKAIPWIANLITSEVLELTGSIKETADFLGTSAELIKSKLLAGTLKGDRRLLLKE